MGSQRASSQVGETIAPTCAYPRAPRTDFLGGRRRRCHVLGDLSKEENALATAPQREAAYGDDEKGFGWLVFAATMLGLAGVFSMIDGIVALSNARFFTANAHYVFSDLRTWGWITLIVGVVVTLAAFGVFSGSQVARWFGIVIAGLSAIGAALFAQAYPLWTLIIFGVDVLVIYALAVYGGRREMA